jgi:hypothetical protein
VDGTTFDSYTDDTNGYGFADQLANFRNYLANYQTDPAAVYPKVDFNKLYRSEMNIGFNLETSNRFLDVLDYPSLVNCDNAGGSSIYNFIHACLVGSNKGLTNLDRTAVEPDDIYKDIF